MNVDPILQFHRSWVIVTSAAVPPLTCWLLSLARGTVANTTAALALVLLVVAAAATGIRVAGIAAALTATAGFDFFLTEPFHAFTITDSDDLETALLLLLVGAAVSEIAIWGRRQQARASREQGYLDGLLGTAGAVAAGAAPTEELIDLVRAQIVTLLDIDSCRFTPSTTPGCRPLPTTAPWTAGAAPSTSPERGCRQTSRSPSRSATAALSTVTSCSPRPPGSSDPPGINSGLR
jgi:K+-sensing histidine kinase KdpD